MVTCLAVVVAALLAIVKTLYYVIAFVLFVANMSKQTHHHYHYHYGAGRDGGYPP